MITSSEIETASGIKRADGSNDRDTAEQISEFAHAAQEKVSAAAEPLKENATNAAEEQKQRGADHMDHLAQAVHGAADELGKEVPQAARYVHSGADQLQRVSHLLRDNSLEDLASMAKRVAHDRPMAFIGGAMAAGFVLARFLRSSAQSPSRMGAGR